MVSKYATIWFVVAALFFGCHCSGINKILEVTISFDSLDSDSKHFFIEQLAPIYEEFSPIIQWQFIPCSTTHIVDDKLSCVSSEACQINKLHACAAHKYENDQFHLGRFFLCMMPDQNQLIKGEECAKTADMDWAWLEECKDSKQAEELCDRRWNLLNELDEDGVPGVIFNRKFDRAVEIEAVKDLKGTICSQLDLLSIGYDQCSQLIDEEK